MYNVQNHYWIVGGSTTQIYSSAGADYVPVTDAVYEAWLASGGVPTQIDTESNLKAVFVAQYPAGWARLALEQSAQAQLDKNDRTATRCVKAGTVCPPAWQAFDKALVAIVNGMDTTSTVLPSAPKNTDGSVDYPA